MKLPCPFPLPNHPPQAGEGANVSLREFHVHANEANTKADIIEAVLGLLVCNGLTIAYMNAVSAGDFTKLVQV